MRKAKQQDSTLNTSTKIPKPSNANYINIAETLQISDFLSYKVLFS
jgi:hypothetical protein